jgi:hypothetical protein
MFQSFQMRHAAAAILVSIFTLASAPAHARKEPPAKIVKQAEPMETDLETHDHYKNKAGQAVHSPAKSKTGAVPAGASAQCRDATYSFSRNHRGTCSHHGGVAAWL